MWSLIIRPIEILKENVGGKIEGVVAGWGRYTIDGFYSDTLKFITAETRTNDECRKELPPNVQHLIHDSSLCAFPELSRGK
jgi:glycosidase